MNPAAFYPLLRPLQQGDWRRAQGPNGGPLPLMRRTQPHGLPSAAVGPTRRGVVPYGGTPVSEPTELKPLALSDVLRIGLYVEACVYGLPLVERNDLLSERPRQLAVPWQADNHG